VRTWSRLRTSEERSLRQAGGLRCRPAMAATVRLPDTEVVTPRGKTSDVTLVT
jgi:hypothetical protein